MRFASYRPAGADDLGACPELPFVPALAPPPVASAVAFTDNSPRFNPFDRPPDDIPVEGGTYYYSSRYFIYCSTWQDEQHHL